MLPLALEGLPFIILVVVIIVTAMVLVTGLVIAKLAGTSLWSSAVVSPLRIARLVIAELWSGAPNTLKRWSRTGVVIVVVATVAYAAGGGFAGGGPPSQPGVGGNGNGGTGGQGTPAAAGPGTPLPIDGPAAIAWHERVVRRPNTSAGRIAPRFGLSASVRLGSGTESVVFRTAGSNGTRRLAVVNRSDGRSRNVTIADGTADRPAFEPGTRIVAALPSGEVIAERTVGVGWRPDPSAASDGAGLPYVRGSASCGRDLCSVNVYVGPLGGAEGVRVNGSGVNRTVTAADIPADLNSARIPVGYFIDRRSNITAVAMMGNGTRVVVARGTPRDMARWQWVRRGPGRPPF